MAVGSFLVFICVMTVSILLPVMQAAYNREVSFEIGSLEQQIQELEEKNRVLVGEIAVLKSPEALMKSIGEDGIERATEDEIVILEER